MSDDWFGKSVDEVPGLGAVVKGWQIIEDTLVEAGLDRPQAERLSKAIAARLAKGGILLATEAELKD